MGGVALASGGFVMAACVYIFHLKKYHPIIRPAVLTAFLGYAAVIVGLVFDVGLPWNLWRPLYSWQHHSALFEVAMCVMFYFHVLALEFAPVIFERLPFKRIYKLLKALTLPLVIFGIILSTLHQSSLGTLLVIMPFRIHPLWYSSILPIFFFVSAVGLGLTMVITESLVSSWLYEREIEKDLLSGLAKAASYVLGFYVIIKLAELAYNKELHYLVDGSWEANLFIFETLISAVVPAVLFSFKRVRESIGGLAVGAIMAVAGFVLNRIDVSGLATVSATGTTYFPSWMEIAISVGVVSGAALVFFFFVENFSVYEEDGESEEKEYLLVKDPVRGIVGYRLLLPPMPNIRQNSVALAIGAVLGAILLFDVGLYGPRPEKTPVERALSIDALRTKPEDEILYVYSPYDPEKGDIPEGWELTEALLIDGDRKNKYVIFNHEEHKNLSGSEQSCRMCHHMDEPSGKTAFCHECHRDMFLPTEIVDKAGQVVYAPPYREAMHSLCIECHEEMDPPIARCGGCHQGVDVSVPPEREAFALIAERP